MKNKFQLMIVFSTIIIILFPSSVFSESKDVMSEYCNVYSGDMKNKNNLDEFKKSISEKAKENAIQKLVKEFHTSNISSDCVLNVINNYLEKVAVLRHIERVEENGKIICDKVKITYDPDEINRYLSQEFCLKGWDAGKEYSNWCHDVEKVVPVKKGKLNLGLIIETKIPNIDANKKDILENEEEQQFSEMVKINKDKYNVIDKGSFIKAAEEHKISLYGITDKDILQLGKLLNLDVIVHRVINKNSRTTKVRRINTGKVLLFNVYETAADTSGDTSEAEPSETIASEWVKYGEDKRGTLHYYKKGNVNKDSDVVKVLNKWVFSKREISDAIQYRRENRLSAKGYNKLSHMIYLSEIDCQNQSERMLYLFLYDTDGKSLYSHTFSNPEWTLIQPESNGETIHKAVCK